MSDIAGDRGHRVPFTAAPVGGLDADGGGPDEPIPYSVVSESSARIGQFNALLAGQGRPVDGVVRWKSALDRVPVERSNWTEAEIYPAAGKVYDKALRTLCEKHLDYGPTNISQAPGGALNGVLVRMWDKMARVRHLIERDAEPKNESLRDSFLDLMNYSAIALMVIDEDWPK